MAKAFVVLQLLGLGFAVLAFLLSVLWLQVKEAQGC